RRARDDAQHLRGRRLLLQCFGELARARLELAFQLARVRLELLFRRSLRFLRRVKMTHVGRPQAEDPSIRKDTTPAPLLCETIHAAGSLAGPYPGVHPLGWTDGEGENRLTEPGFRGESPWPSTARIRSSSSARSSKNFWVGSHCTPSRGATGSAA